MIGQEFLILYAHNDVVCYIDEGKKPVCEKIAAVFSTSGPARTYARTKTIKVEKVPSYVPYIPRAEPIFYDCTDTLECKQTILYSLTQVVPAKTRLFQCFKITTEHYDCERVKFNHMKQPDQLLFLNRNIKHKIFFYVDCFLYDDGARVCAGKTDMMNSYEILIHFSHKLRPNEANIYVQDELLCEESEDLIVNCDLYPYVPFGEELKAKDTATINSDLSVKTLSGREVSLLFNCFEGWCGYTSNKNLRKQAQQYDGKTYRCFYGNEQQVCREIFPYPSESLTILR